MKAGEKVNGFLRILELFDINFLVVSAFQAFIVLVFDYSSFIDHKQASLAMKSKKISLYVLGISLAIFIAKKIVFFIL